MPSGFTNAPATDPYIVRTSVRLHRPYVASHYSNKLTAKERVARQVVKSAAALVGAAWKK